MNTEVFVACVWTIIGHGVLLIYLFTTLDSKIDKLLASAASQTDPGWRDIDSAPRDRVILLMDRQGIVQAGQWCDEHARWYVCPCCDDWVNPVKWREIPH